MISLIAVLASTLSPLAPATTWEAWPSSRAVSVGAACLRHDGLVRAIRDLEARHRGLLRVEEAGRSTEDRPVLMMTVGRGPRTVMLWSQMHGDEPSATPALLDLASYLLRRAEDPAVRRVLDRLTVVMVPMVNPDGAERYVRRNAQAIDVNRDALNLATPEGRLLKSVRDRLRPILGFNLHDQDRRTTVGDTGKLATLSLLAVAGDPAGTMSEGRWRARRVASALVAALSPFVEGRFPQRRLSSAAEAGFTRAEAPDEALAGARTPIEAGIGRYDEDWSPRAFGDNFTAWGTPVVLVESGGLAGDRSLADLTRMNFVALLAALDALADDDAQAFDPAVYETLPRNVTGAWADVVLRGGEVRQGTTEAPYRADVAFNVHVPDAARFGCAPADDAGSRIVEVGDARFLGSARLVDTAGRVIVPALAVSVRGVAARDWLGGPVLRQLARLGVAVVRWHVRVEDLGPARVLAAEWSGPGRARVLVVGESEPAAALAIEAPPRIARGDTLGARLDAIAPRWGSVLAKGGFSPLFRAAAAGEMSLPNPIAIDAPADVMVLRPAAGNRLDERAVVESVWLDGREIR